MVEPSLREGLAMMGSFLMVVEVGGMVRQETSLTNTAAQSQGTCISDLHQLTSYIFNDDGNVEIDLKKPSCQLGSNGLLEADHQHLLLLDDPCDLAKALKELPHHQVHLGYTSVSTLHLVPLQC